MAIKMTRFKEPILKKPLPKRLAVYGEPMAGKTTLAGKASKPYFISFDRNAKEAGYNGEVPEKYDDVINIIDNAAEFGYETIVIDTVEDMAQLLEDEIISKYKANSLKDANGGYGAGYSEFSKAFTSIVRALSQSGLNVYYLMRARMTDDGLSVVLKDKQFDIIGGYSDGLIEINNKHEAKWMKKRYDWDEKELKKPLDAVLDPLKARNEKLKELGLD
ncbi:MAG: hypothetical protein DUD32_04575 [Lactobacillus sp.]|jgi:adenylate kinase family enzyme|nr:MAG: hypothetical protein DUD32_04575 [Lactobacillus sp.]